MRGANQSSTACRRAVLLDNQLSELAKLQQLVESFCSEQAMPCGLDSELMLIAEELVVNTISYGYDDGERHHIEVVCELCDGQLQMSFVDDGRAFNPLLKEPPELGLPSSQAAIGGLGIPMVMALSDRQEYYRDSDKNVLRIYKSIN